MTHETLDLAGVLAIRKDTKNSLYRDIRGGRFPQPLKVGRRSIWLKSEVDVWLAERAVARQIAELEALEFDDEEDAPRIGPIESAVRREALTLQAWRDSIGPGLGDIHHARRLITRKEREIERERAYITAECRALEGWRALAIERGLWDSLPDVDHLAVAFALGEVQP